MILLLKHGLVLKLVLLFKHYIVLKTCLLLKHGIVLKLGQTMQACELLIKRLLLKSPFEHQFDYFEDYLRRFRMHRCIYKNKSNFLFYFQVPISYILHIILRRFLLIINFYFFSLLFSLIISS